MEQGWSLKKMHRLIMLSGAYRMSARVNPEALLIDPENRLLWRMNPRRLEAEPFRDALLAVAGSLDLGMGGTLLTTPNNDYVTNDQSANAARYDNRRRSVYLPVIRNAVYDMFQAFDFGDPSMLNARRSTTTVAPQALFVMNSPFVLDQAKGLAAQALSAAASDAGRIRFLYLRLYARPPDLNEIERARRYLAAYAARIGSREPDPARRVHRAWESLCHVLLASNEFITVD
jgi:hypothetical protein